MLARTARPEGSERLPTLRPAASGRRALKALLVAVSLALAIASGCGGDEEPSAENAPPLPELTIPRTDPEPEPVETEPEPEAAPEPEATPEPEAPAAEPDQSAPPPATDGGSPAPPPEAPADTPENDTPPPPNSPAERFEDFCNENPGACG